MLTLIAYLRTVFTHPGEPPLAFSVRADAASFRRCGTCKLVRTSDALRVILH